MARHASAQLRDLFEGPGARSFPAIWLAVVVFLGGCETARFEPVVETFETPAGDGAAEPNLASGPGGDVLLSWVEPHGAGHAMRFAKWNETTWSDARGVASGDSWFVNWADFPSMAMRDRRHLAAHWLAKVGEGTYAYGIELALSSDGGESWTAPVVPHRDGTETEHGFVSLVPGVAEGFGVVWLDGRRWAREDLPESERSMTLRFATVSGDGKLANEVELDERVCDCCPTDAVATDDGSIVVVYRDRSNTEIRDVSSCRFDGESWSPPTPVRHDGWEIAGCPVNGPALAALGERVGCAWYTEGEDGSPKVYLALSNDRGRTWDAPIRVDEGTPLGRVDLAFLENGRLVVSWLESRAEAEDAELLVREWSMSGGPGPVVSVARTAATRAAGTPRMTARSNEVFLAWTVTGEVSRVRTARIRSR